MANLEVQNATFAETRLTAEEMLLLTTQWKELWMPPWSFERQFVNQRWNNVLAGIQAGKNALEELKFGGFNCADSELGISPIRPGHVGLVNGTDPEADNVWKWKHDCVKAANAVGFENWIHSPTAPTTQFQIHEDSFIIPIYVLEENCSPRIQTIKMDIGRANILHYDVCASRLRDYATGTNLIPLPTTFWTPKQDVLVALQHKMNGTTEPRLGGFTVAKGSFLDATTYAASTHTVAVTNTAST